MKITEKQYAESLHIVREDLKQIEFEVQTTTSAEDWIKKVRIKNDGEFNTGDVRLFNCLKAADVKEVELLTKKQFLRFRNAGKKSWEIFTELRGY